MEITESTTPILVARREYRCDSAGPGRCRGGLGQTIEIEGRGETDLVLFGTVDRVAYPARGRECGHPGAPGHLRLSTGETFSGKGACKVPAGTRLLVETPGGGGYGDPFRRPADKVAEDYSQGMISREAARNHYGIVLRQDGSVDMAATNRLRGSSASDGATA